LGLLRLNSTYFFLKSSQLTPFPPEDFALVDRSLLRSLWLGAGQKRAIAGVARNFRALALKN